MAGRHRAGIRPETVLVLLRSGLAAAARAERTSPRTLRRRLARTGTTVRSLVTATRRDLVARLVREGASPEAIASLAGLSTPTSLRQFVRRNLGPSVSAALRLRTPAPQPASGT